jgi:hypothetical protein
VLLVSVLWVLDKRYSRYLSAVAAKSVHLEKMMREELSGTAIKNAYDSFTRAERFAVPAFYTIMIALGILLSWIAIASRVASYLGVFYVGFVIYAILYAYWILRIWKMG